MRSTLSSTNRDKFEDGKANAGVKMDLPSRRCVKGGTFASPISDSENDYAPQKELISNKKEKRQRINNDAELEGRRKRLHRVSASVNVFNVAVKSP